MKFNVNVGAVSSNSLPLRSPSLIRTPSISQVIREAMAVQLNVANPLREIFVDCGGVTTPVCVKMPA